MVAAQHKQCCTARRDWLIVGNLPQCMRADQIACEPVHAVKSHTAEANICVLCHKVFRQERGWTRNPGDDDDVHRTTTKFAMAGGRQKCEQSRKAAAVTNTHPTAGRLLRVQDFRI